MGFLKKDLGQIDLETGELHEGLTVLVPTRQKLRSDFAMMSREGFLRLAKERDLTGEDRRVLDVYLGNLDFENYIQIDQQSIADYLELTKQSVSRSTKKLVDKSILVKGPRVGKHNTYRLNAFFGWKGRITKNYQDTYEEHSRLIK